MDARNVLTSPMEVDSSPEDNSSSDDSSSVSSVQEIPDLRRKANRVNLNISESDFIELERAFSGNLKTYFLKNNSAYIKDICFLLTTNHNKMRRLILTLLITYTALKFNIVVECTYVRPHTGETQNRAFKTANMTVLSATSVSNILVTMFRKICDEEAEYAGKGSGWTLFSVDGVLLRFSRYRPLGGSSYIPLPKSIADKHAVINVKNIRDNQCFKWAILTRYVKGKHRDRLNEKYINLNNKFNFDRIQFPTSLKQIKIFEKLNPGVSVNVYGLDDKNQVYPLRVCTKEEVEHFDLLLITNDKGVSHYCYISQFSRLVSPQVSANDHKLYFCKRCLTHFSKKSDVYIEQHKKDCSANRPVKVVMPQSESILKFTNFHHRDRIPIVVYADFECILKKVDQRQSKFTFINQAHVPMSYCVNVVCDQNLPESIRSKLPQSPYLYRGENADKDFMEYMVSLANTVGDLLNINISMLALSEDDKERVSNCKKCESCDCEFSMMNPAVKDHCHLTGRFRSILCNQCNLKRRNQNYLPVIIHNSSNYDTHFIVKQLHCDSERIDVVPNSSEKYISFSKQTKNKIKLRFLDSFKYLSDSLDRLVSILPRNKFTQTNKFFSDDVMHLVSRKGVYPYEYTDSFEKLNETQLPGKNEFYNKLTEADCTDEDYSHAQEMWSKFGCKTLGEYSDLYLRMDVLLLSDVFENFRDISLQNYQLDPVYYLTLPSLTFDAMLKFTKIELELLTDYNKYMFIEQGIRGGITSCVKRQAKANNKYMGELFDKSKDSSYLGYIDANNLYGWAMCKPMPKSAFEWLSKSEINNFDVLSHSENSETGYIVECDVGYPQHLHDEHDDLPFFPEKKCPPNSKQPKLLLTLENKKNYVCHYLNLKQAIQNGLVLQKIHRVLSFKQSCWLKPYIDFNTEKRKQASNDFEKDFYKLLNNSMFGKSIENVRNRMNLSLVNTEKRLNRLVSRPSFKNRIIYNESLCAVECSREIVNLNKPIYIGFTVLELSKFHMYNFHYRVMKEFFKGKRINLLYIDTDSFFYEIHTDDMYEDFLRLKKYLDLSDYDVNHKCFDSSNQKKLGCFKDETSGVIIVEFVGLRPKLYTFSTMDDDYLKQIKKMKLKKAKGVSKAVIQNHISFDDYKQCLLSGIKNKTNIGYRRKMRLFRSKNHNVETITVDKIALSAADDKRFICRNGVNTLAHGNYSIKHNDDDDVIIISDDNDSDVQM